MEMHGFESAGFFVLRTPLLPFSVLTGLSADLGATTALSTGADFAMALRQDRELVCARMRAYAREPIIREALFLASPTLDAAIDTWLNAPETSRAQDVPLVLFRYLARMSARATPFGLFAGCTYGRLGSCTQLRIGPRATYRRHTRLDGGYLASVCDILHGDPTVRDRLTFHPNTTLYEVPGQYRYAECRSEPSTQRQSHHLVAVSHTPYLEHVLHRATGGATVRELVAHLLEVDPTVDEDEARDFVDELVRDQILVSELTPAITGPSPIDSLRTLLRNCDVLADSRKALDSIAAAVAALDAGDLSQPPDAYKRVISALDGLPSRPETSRVVQVDLYKPSTAVTIGARVLRVLQEGLGVLARVTPNQHRPELGRFKQVFRVRYGDGCMVPLALALDNELGLGFGEAVEPSDLLEGMRAPAETKQSDSHGTRDATLLRGLTGTLRAGRTEWSLSDADLTALEDPHRLPLPDAFSVRAMIAARTQAALDRGQVKVFIAGLYGPSGASLLGRFCQGDRDIHEAVEAHLRDEEALRPDAVFAELVHLPAGTIGNVLFRPVLRSYEIPYLGRSGVPGDRQIPVNDLLVTVTGGTVRLWSSTLAREVIPRLSTAHNARRSALPVYRFLAAVQADGRHANVGWSWGLMSESSFVPRVTYGPTVLALAQWRMTKRDLATLDVADTAGRFDAVQKLRAAHALPRWVTLVDSDNVLPIDLDNVVSVDAFVRLAKARRHAVLQEMFPAEGELVAEGPEGAFLHEVVVPFIRSRAPDVTSAPKAAVQRVEASPGAPLSGRTEGSIRRTFVPGSEWLYIKFYTGSETANAVLTETVLPLVRDLVATQSAHRWFFIRYGDPDWHVRFRVRGDPDTLGTQVLPRVRRAAEKLLERKVIWRVEIGTYEREIERYGGERAIELAEEVFEADSEAVLDVLNAAESRERPEICWQLALRSCHLLLTDFGFDARQRLEIVRRAHSHFGREQLADATFDRQSGTKFRALRPTLEKLLRVGDGVVQAPLERGYAALSARSQRMAHPIAELRRLEQFSLLSQPLSELADSYLHMHCNRMFSAAHWTHERVIYDWLSRLYETEIALTGRRGKSGVGF